MTIEEMKKYLGAYRVLRREIARQEMRLRDAERMERWPALWDGGKDREMVGQMVQARRHALASLVEASLLSCRAVEGLIGRVEGKSDDKTWLYRQILGMHYLDGLTFEKISGELHYHERHIRRLHREALEAAVRAKEA